MKRSPRRRSIVTSVSFDSSTFPMSLSALPARVSDIYFGKQPNRHDSGATRVPNYRNNGSNDAIYLRANETVENLFLRR